MKSGAVSAGGAEVCERRASCLARCGERWSVSACIRRLSWVMLCLPGVGILLRRFIYLLNHSNLGVCGQMLRLLRNAEEKKNLQGRLATCAIFIPEILRE